MQAFLEQRGEDYDDCKSYSDLVSECGPST